MIDEVLRKPTQVLVLEEIKVFQSLIVLDDKKYLLRVFVNDLVVPNVVITVYLTKKIMKYFGENYEN